MVVVVVEEMSRGVLSVLCLYTCGSAGQDRMFHHHLLPPPSFSLRVNNEQQIIIVIITTLSLSLSLAADCDKSLNMILC